VEQLRDFIRRGHDVQLHLHPSWFNARFEAGHWKQDWSEYNFAELTLSRMTEIVGIGKRFLETLLRPVDPTYRCIAFRAANWAVHPSRNVIQALVENDIMIDTSVFKYGQRRGLVSFDYSHAHSNMVPWRVDDDDICKHSDQGRLMEIPIYSEKRWLGAFFTSQRIYRVCVSRSHRMPEINATNNGSSDPFSSEGSSLLSKLQRVFRSQAWKADFNQCTGGQLARALERASCVSHQSHHDLPFVLIGHSKLFTPANSSSLLHFLAHVGEHPERFSFGTLIGASQHLGSLPTA
jgi:hypothetical protein